MNIEHIMTSLEAKHPGESEYFKRYTRCYSLSKRYTTNTPSSKKPN